MKQSRSVERPKITPEREALALQLAHENVRSGYDPLEGEMLKLRFTIDRPNIRNPDLGLGQHFAETGSGTLNQAEIHRRDVLDGIIHDY